MRDDAMNNHWNAIRSNSKNNAMHWIQWKTQCNETRKKKNVTWIDKTTKNS